ncbi:hypothetical protein RSAG8_12270, partial [Rhizoctonia solani AG-8 WAC10335]
MSRKPSPVTAYQWKEAHDSLDATISRCSKICSQICSVSQVAETSRNDLISQLDSARSALTSQLGVSQAMLARARNRLASPVYNLPEEIIFVIFMHVLYHNDEFRSTTADISARTFYERLYALLEVCSVWRAVALSRPALWSLVPVIRGPQYFTSDQATALSLHRSDTVPLDLFVMVPRTIPHPCIKALTQHTSRFRTVNIVAEGPCTIQSIMGTLLKNKLSDKLSELSVCISDLEHVNRFADEPYYMFPPNTSDHPLFLRTLKSLTRFRITGATLDWTQVSFSGRLLELRLHSVILGLDSSLHNFLRAISTAPQLQKLELISIISYSESNLASPPAVSFPALQTLIVEDL